MSLTLAQFETEIAAMLFDPANAMFTTAVIDANLRMALSEFQDAAPYAMETTITLPGTGREIALNGITNLLQVLMVWWPYATTGNEVWPPNRVRGYRLWWDDGQPVLFLDIFPGAQPQINDVVRVWYTIPHKIQNLDSGDITTVGEYEQLIIRGAAGLCCASRAIELNETSGNMAVSTPNYAALAEFYLRDKFAGFYVRLEQLRSQGKVIGQPFGEGWRIDKQDARGDLYTQDAYLKWY